MRHYKTFLTLSLTLSVFTVHATIPSWEILRNERVDSDNSVVWEQISPGNAGFVNLVRYHPTIPGKVMICPDMWSAYQSDNNGERWYTLTDYDGDASFFHLRDFYYSPSEPEMGLAICSSELWQTHDMGKSWDVIRDCPWYDIDKEGRDGKKSKKVASLAIDPNNADVWFVGGGMNVRGQEWLSCYVDITQKHPHGHRSEYEGKMWRTTDGGKSWNDVSCGLDPKAQVGRIIVNPNNSKQVFASSNYGIYRSDDSGSSWKMVSEGYLDNNIIMDMDAYYNPDNRRFILYAIDQTQYTPNAESIRSTGGIFSSKDCGESWEKINGNLALDINRLTGGVVETYYKYITRWFDENDLDKLTKYPTKQDVEAMMAKYPKLPTDLLQTFWMISADPSREGALYIGMADPQTCNSIMPGRLWSTSDNGETWINTARLYPENWEDDKEYWLERGNPIDVNMSVGHQSPHQRSGTNYALRSMRGVDVGVDGSVMMISDHSTMLSTDNGATWQQVDETYTPSGAIIGHGNSNMCVSTIEQDRRSGTTLIGSSEHHLWIPELSKDGKIALRQVTSTPPTARCLAFDPYNIDVVYTTTSRQEEKQYIYRSDDRGENWGRHGIATPATNAWMDDFYTNSLLIDPINSQYMYHGITTVENKDRLTEGGFFRSNDGGKTFKQYNNGLPKISRVKQVIFDPRDKSNASLFIAIEIYGIGWRGPKTTEGGLYHTTNRGESWTKVATPESVVGVQNVIFDNTDRMYITTGHIGGGGDGVWCSDDFGTTWRKVFEEKSAECFGISPFDNNLIAVSVCGGKGSRNPGFYISRDRGETWSKSNTNFVIPHQITDIQFDLFEPGKIWLGAYGAGAYRGVIENGDQIQVVEALPNSAEIHNKKAVKFTATIVNSKYKGAKIVWKSDNERVATVDNKGVVTPVGRGQVKIWATTEDYRFTDYSIVTVH